MKSLTQTTLLGLCCLALSSCGLFGGGKKDDLNAEKGIPKYENYSSSGIYADIEGEAGDSGTSAGVQDLAAAQGRQTSSEDYSDDDYGELGSDKDELFVDGMDDEENNEEPAPMNEPGESQLPETEVAAVAAVSVPAFKNGMYRTKRDCNMREEADPSSGKAGVVKKGKKLWMEAHNDGWVKVFKKSGAVYLSRSCL
jgi:uncharacterized protein YgiM (DUF1202 family)